MTKATSQASGSFNRAVEPSKVADNDNSLLHRQIEAEARKAADGSSLVRMGLHQTAILKP